MKESPEGEEISIEEACFTLKLQGWVKIYAEKLEDYLILVKRGVKFIPVDPDDKDIPVYVIEEMDALKDIGIEELKILHEAKKLFNGKISKSKKKSLFGK